MDKPKNTVHIQFISIPENVSLARVLVASIATQLDLNLNDLEELKVAVSEAVSNAIIHGYQNDREGMVNIEINCYQEKLVITVTDMGVGIADIKLALEPSFTTDPQRMGLGFVFIKSFMDHLEVNSEPNKGTQVIMVKNLVFRQES